MATGVSSWSQTAATNASADSAVNFAEGQAPSTVNDSARGLMSSVAKYRDDTAGTLTTGGTSTAYTLSTNQGFASLAAMSGAELTVKFNATNGAAPTLAVDSLTAKAINVSTATAVGTGVILANSIWSVTYDNSNNCFILRGVPAAIQDGTVATASIASNAVTYAKIQTVAASSLIGNATGSTATPTAITVGSGLALSGTTLTSAFSPPALFKNLSIKVASNTTVTVAADFVVTTDGTTYQTTALSGTVNLGTNGAANALDAGTIAIDTWYAIWAIAKADGTTAALASTSATAPTLPSGYTFKARLGWVRTIHASATLYGTWQFGRRAQYVVGLAQTADLPSLGTGSNAGTWQTLSVSSYVPTTASEIALTLFGQGNAGGGQQYTSAAPNSSYSNTINGTPVPPLRMGLQSTNLFINDISANVLLESTNVYMASSAMTSATLYCNGWTDNI